DDRHGGHRQHLQRGGGMQEAARRGLRGQIQQRSLFCGRATPPGNQRSDEAGSAERMTTREDVVRVARTYLDTPFAHRQRLPGVGLGRAALLICMMRETGLEAPDFDVPEYDPTPDGATMRAWCEQYMQLITQDEMQAGDAVLFITDKYPQHLGILADYAHGGFSIIHAANNARPPRVIETRLMFSRTFKFVAAYSFRGIA